MADKILRRTSYGGEQTENISKFQAFEGHDFPSSFLSWRY